MNTHDQYKLIYADATNSYHCIEDKVRDLGSSLDVLLEESCDPSSSSDLLYSKLLDLIDVATEIRSISDSLVSSLVIHGDNQLLED